SIPLKIIAAVLDYAGDVTEPQRPPRAVPQQMRAQDAKLILFGQHAERCSSESKRFRMRDEFLHRFVIQLAEPFVYIDAIPFRFGTPQDLYGPLILQWTKTQIHIAVRSEPLLRIESGNGPSLHQKRFDTFGVKQ